MNKTTIYYDFEASGVSRDADCISVGLVAVTEKEEVLPTKDLAYRTNKIQDIKTFYAEFTNFNIDKCDDWVKENIVGKLYLQNSDMRLYSNDIHETENETFVLGNTDYISRKLKQWLSQFESIEFWADFPIIDVPMLIDLIADWDTVNPNNFKFNSRTEVEEFGRTLKDVKIGLPKHLPNIRYDQFFDLRTLFKIKGIDTDISREEFIGDLINEIPEGQSHNALYDSYVNWKVHQKLMSI